MSIEKSALRVTELDFDSIRENLKNYLRSQSEFQDFDFEGSGMSVLLDILAYNTHYMGFYLNMVGNEMFLDSAQLRSSILSHAKAINYIPGSSQGALSKINVRVTPSNSEDTSVNTLTLDKYTRIVGQDKDGVNYPFVTLNSYTASKNTGTFSFANVFVKQGEAITLQYITDSANPRRRFEIPSANVDTETLSVTVQESSSNSYTEVYQLAEDLTEITAASRVYFIEENDNLNYTITFGDGVIGKKPKDGNIVTITYLDNLGSVSNNISKFVFTEPLGGKFRNNVVVSSTVSSYGGVDKETIEQVRFRAPNFYSTQNRAVTELDYKTLLQKDYNYIESVSVWGGEKNDPVVYGKMFLSIKTKGNYALTNLEKEQIKEDLIKKRNVITVTPEIVDPDFNYLLLKGSVYYDSSLSNRTADELSNLVRASISDYISSELNLFESTFRKSKLQFYMENSDPSITGSDIKVYAQKRFKVDTNNTRNYIIDFNIPLKQNPHYERLFSFPSITVFDSSGIARQAYIEEEYEALTGIRSIQVLNGGRGYESAPTVSIIGDGSGATARAVVKGGKVTEVAITNPGRNYTIAQIRVTGGNPLEPAALIATLEAEVGNLRTFYYQSNGRKVVLNSKAGTINYKSGRVVLNSLKVESVEENEFYDDNYLSINIQADTDIISPIRNRIVTVDENDPKSISIDIIAE